MQFYAITYKKRVLELMLFFAFTMLIVSEYATQIIRIKNCDISSLNSYTIVDGNCFKECDVEIEIISNKNIYRRYTFRHYEGVFTFRNGNDCALNGISDPSLNHFFQVVNGQPVNNIKSMIYGAEQPLIL